VHNGRDGRIPTWLTLELERMRQENPHIKIETVGYSELLEEALKLEQDQLVDLFGPFPSRGDLVAMQYEDVRPLLGYVSSQSVPADIPPRPVPSGKLEYNHLSEDVRYCLRTGMIKAGMVQSYLDRTPDKELAARVTSAFRTEYDRLRQQETDPDRIFNQLRSFTQGPFLQMPRFEIAALAVLAYLFEECDIFESLPQT
jgi:hypothetical protein